MITFFSYFCKKTSGQLHFFLINKVKNAITQVLVFIKNLGSGNDSISLEVDILTKVAGQGKVFAYMNKCNNFWMSIKSAGSAIYANRTMLDLYKKYHPNRLVEGKDLQEKFHSPPKFNTKIKN